MARIFDGFNTQGEAEMDDFDAIPAGNYTAAIVKSEMKDNKAGTGSFLNLHFKITEGKFKDRLVFTNLNLVNPSDQAVAIARKELTSIVKACGKVSIEDSDELHGVEIEIKVAVRAATSQFPEGNDIKGYKALSGVASPSPSASSGDTSSSGEGKSETQTSKPKVSFD
jgi:hypothetical protein